MNRDQIFSTFGLGDENSGVYAAGCATHPCDVSRTTKESTAAALKAIQCLNRG